MTTKEHLDKIVAKIDQLLELAEKRTPGKWSWDAKFSDSAEIFEPRIWLGGSSSLPHKQQLNNAPYIAACAGAAEAGWRATQAAIKAIPQCCDGQCGVTDSLKEIIAAWPEELL